MPSRKTSLLKASGAVDRRRWSVLVTVGGDLRRHTINGGAEKELET